MFILNAPLCTHSARANLGCVGLVHVPEDHEQLLPRQPRAVRPSTSSGGACVQGAGVHVCDAVTDTERNQGKSRLTMTTLASLNAAHGES